MSEKQPALEAMNCEELLKELARLTSERDHIHSQIGTPAQASPEQAPQIDHLLDQGARIDRIGELIKARGCQ
jgi:hypothetical protein